MAQEVWNVKTVEEGLKGLHALLGRMPTATEIDAYEGLPSARQLQRRFGGVVKVRKDMGYKDADLSRGEHRSNIARKLNVDGLDLENRVYSLLKDRFGEICVHQQKPTGLGKQALDFYVYTPDGRFGVDVFCAKNLSSLKTNIRQKKNNYIDYSGKLYLVYESPAYIDSIEDGSVVLLSLAEFLEEVKRYKRYEMQITYLR